MFRDVDQLRLPDPYYSGEAGFIGSTLEQLHQDMRVLELPPDVPESVRRYHDGIETPTCIRIIHMMSISGEI
jgi:hypothetical protein